MPRLLAVIGAAVLGRTRLPPTQNGPDGSKPDGCEDASKQWDAARQMACNAKRDQDAAHLTAADDDLLAKIRVRQAWDAEVVRLRAAILSACPPETANAVLSRPGPC
ncbi:hypothetical protein [Sphingomonas koreensis]